MAFSLWPTPFVGRVFNIPAAFLNKVRTELARAIDSNGGTHTATTKLEILGAGADIEIGGDPASRTFLSAGGGIRITGELRATDVDVLTMSGTDRVGYASRTITRVHHVRDTVADPAYWELSTSSTLGSDDLVPHWTTPHQAPQQRLWIPFSVPHGATLDEVAVLVVPPEGHVSVPAAPPAIDVFSQEPLQKFTVGDATLLGTGTFSGDLTTYENGFWLAAATDYAHEGDALLWARIKTEETDDGLKVLALRTTCTVTSQDEHVAL